MITQETTIQQLNEQLADYGLRFAAMRFYPHEAPAERCTVRLVGIDDNKIFLGMCSEFVDAVNDALADVEATGAINV